ncbi:MAG: RagB/SusD family nutrient uptake outer membrane protein [Prevotellaceae bacterium]|nr:RagB/SusD family nutrient uptake outer membrane protein [Prevotellaceae bacterium]
MKRTIIAFTLSVGLLSLTTACSDDFLQKKHNYGSFTDEVYNDYTGAKERVDYLYAVLSPVDGSMSNYHSHSGGSSDIWSQCTEEYSGFSDYVNPDKVIDNVNVEDYIYGEQKNVSPYGRIRECNLVIQGITNGTLPAYQKAELLGQAYFFRGWAYYRLVKIYGGIPLIDHPQNPIPEGNSLIVPRSTTKACIDFICADFQTAADLLPATYNDNNWGRVTKSTAMGMLGRARLLYASPIYNRADDQERWREAYEANKAAVDTLEASHYYQLYGENDPGVNASKWAQIWMQTKNPEALWSRLHNTIESGDVAKNNRWENSIRPANLGGGGGKQTTLEMVDLFPMIDGFKPGESSDYPYNPQYFFLNRDPRFYRTFAFAGVKWSASADLSSVDPPLEAKSYPYANGQNYVLWSYAWYKDDSDRQSSGSTGWAAQGLGDGKAYIYIRKKTDDLQVNNTPTYVYEWTNRFKRSAAPYIELRYAEVLLNYAEAACGVGRLDEAIGALRRIRARVGYRAEILDKWTESLSKFDRGKLFGAILYERQIELAYEGKRFNDMQRWMLWDGGQGQEQLKSTWKLTGYNGNTCTYLGVEPFNGQRRHGIEVKLKEGYLGEEKDGEDPLEKDAAAKAARDGSVLDLMSAQIEPVDMNDDNDASPIKRLADFYKNYLHRLDRRTDSESQYIHFRPEYYILGLPDNMQSNNPKLEQTIGWGDYMHGGADGTFDVLAE